MNTNNTKKLHFIAIGGSAMHNLAIALSRAGYNVGGSDDQIFEPSRSRLAKENILPKQEGWFPEKIVDADEIILGMHAKTDNPELLKAQAMGKTLYSYPEFLAHAFDQDKRVVIAGSHGKTTITSMLLHVLHQQKRSVKYMVGAQLDGFDCMVNLKSQESLAIIEGDEYLSSPIDRRSKFLWYSPHIAIITGIAWDHFNVFKTEVDYIRTFTDFVLSMQPSSTLIYANEPNVWPAIEAANRTDINYLLYDVPRYEVEDAQYVFKHKGERFPLHVIGKHNMLNVEGARLLAQCMGIESDDFLTALRSFSGAAKRLESFTFKNHLLAFRDFAHAPSKVKATVDGVKEAYPNQEIRVFLELHTYSSLNPSFILNYHRTCSKADSLFVYFDKKAMEIKRMAPIDSAAVNEAFDHPNLTVLSSKEDLAAALAMPIEPSAVLLFLSSGNFGGMV